MADVDLFDKIGGIEVPVDPFDLVMCESCQ
jgi:hypothetical protein